LLETKVRIDPWFLFGEINLFEKLYKGLYYDKDLINKKSPRKITTKKKTKGPL